MMTCFALLVLALPVNMEEYGMMLLDGFCCYVDWLTG